MSSRDVTQTYRPVPGQRAYVRRPGAVYLHTTRCVDRYGMPADGVEDGYVGRSRDVARRTNQHAGLVPQRDGTVCEQPWWDLKVGDVQILERGMFTDDELDTRERYWIASLQPRFNELDNPRPDRIRKLEARRHRDARDAARGLVPRQWEPLQIDPVTPVTPGRVWPTVKRVLRSAWTWWFLAWAASTVTAWIVVGWLADEIGQVLMPSWQLLLAAALATAGVGRLWWWASGRKRWRRWKRRLTR
jgi:hypothetical protein